MIRHRVTTWALFIAGSSALGVAGLPAQSATIGSTELVLGMSAESATRQLAREFKLVPNPGKSKAWTIMDSVGTSDFRYRGQISVQDGRITNIRKSLMSDHVTATSVGEALFLLLDRLAPDSRAGCRIESSRVGIESGPGAGGSILNATIKCAHYDGSLIVYQGSDPSFSHDPGVEIVLKAVNSSRSSK